MPERKLIYTLFTLENKIPLEKDSLDLLHQTVNPKDLHLLVESYKHTFGTNLIPFDKFKAFVQSNKKTDKYFILNNLNYKDGSFLRKYTFLKTKTTDTVLIDKLTNKENCTIFGMFYIKDGRKIIEDESGTIFVELPVEGNYYVADYIFICANGYKDAYNFKIQSISYPKINVPMNKNKQIAKKDVCILFFNGQIDKTSLRTVLEGYEDGPEIVVITGTFKNFDRYVEELSKMCKTCEFIFVPSRDDFYNYKLPKYIVSSLQTETLENVHFASNPCEILLNNRKIVILKDDYLYEMKENGHFGTDKRKEKMLEALVSQYSYHVSDMPESSYEIQPDLYVINERTMGYNETVEGVKLVTVERFDVKNEFLMYDASDNSIEMCQLTKSN